MRVDVHDPENAVEMPDPTFGGITEWQAMSSGEQIQEHRGRASTVNTSKEDGWTECPQDFPHHQSHVSAEHVLDVCFKSEPGDLPLPRFPYMAGKGSSGKCPASDKAQLPCHDSLRRQLPPALN